MRIPSSKRLIATCACTSNSIQCAARSGTGYRWTFRIVKSGSRGGTTRKPESLAERLSASARTSNPPGWRPVSEPELVIVATTVLLDIHSASTPSRSVPSDILMFHAQLHLLPHVQLAAVCEPWWRVDAQFFWRGRRRRARWSGWRVVAAGDQESENAGDTDENGVPSQLPPPLGHSEVPPVHHGGHVVVRNLSYHSLTVSSDSFPRKE